MNTTATRKKISFLSIALGSLIVTSLSTGNAEASWSGPRCSLQCTKSKIGKSDTKLNECATNCDNTKIMDILLPNADKLNADNQKHFQTALKYQQSTIEKQLKAEMGKKKPSQSKIRDLNAKQDTLIAEINRVGSQTEEVSKAPPRPKSGPHPSRPTSESPSTPPSEETKAPEHPKGWQRPSRPTSKTTSDESSTHSQMGSHRKKPDVSQPPSDLPPPYISQHDQMPPPSDMPPTLEVHQTPSKSHEEPKKGNIPTPPPSAPVLGQNPRAILKADIQAQNPGKKPFEIDAMLKQKLETDHAGKSAAEINQALKEHYEGQHPGKSHAEILEAVKAGGGQGPSVSPTVTPSKGTRETPNLPSGQNVKQPPKTSNQPDTNAMFSEMQKKVAERQKRLSQSGNTTPQPEAPTEYNLSEQEQNALSRRFGIAGGEEAKKEAEVNLANAKKTQNKADIAKYSAHLDFINKKIEAESGEGDWDTH